LLPQADVRGYLDSVEKPLMPNMALSSLISGMAVSSLKMFPWARVP
jgi:hypothetical protein